MGKKSKTRRRIEDALIQLIISQAQTMGPPLSELPKNVIPLSPRHTRPNR
jgi:hypothetical protein